jgi:arylsulfatase A-like enzyme
MWKKGTYGASVIPVDGFGSPDWDSSQAGPKLTEKALSFIDAHLADNERTGTRRPFFLYYASQSCHTPHTPPAELGGQAVKGVSGIDAHLDILHEADLTLGLLVEKLRAEGELANTLFLFTSDNGGLSWGRPGKAEDRHRSSGPLRGGKAEIWEGGHRVPLIARWGDGTRDGSVIAPGSRSDALIGIQDIYATLAELTGQSPAPDQGLDSFSFLPVLTGQTDPPRRTSLFVQANNEDRPGQRLTRMVRKGEWKLITTRAEEPLELYNLNTDLAEEHNLIDHPEHQPRRLDLQRELRRIMKSGRSTPRWKN